MRIFATLLILANATHALSGQNNGTQPPNPETKLFRARGIIRWVDAEAAAFTVDGLGNFSGLSKEDERTVYSVLGVAPVRLTLTDAERKDLLHKLAEEDRVEMHLRLVKGQPAGVTADSVRPRSIAASNVSRFAKLGLLLGPVSVLFLLAMWLSKMRSWKLFFVGADDRMSNSKTQGAMWLFLIVASFLAVFFLRLQHGDGLFGSIGMPPNLAILAGISGLSLVGAKAIRMSKEQTREEELAAKREELTRLQTEVGSLTDAAMETKQKEIDEVAKSIRELEAVEPPAGGASVSDLATDDKARLNFGDFQMITVALLAVIVYFLHVWSFLGTMDLTASVDLPDVDGSVATIFGVSQAGYLGNKAGSQPGG